MDANAVLADHPAQSSHPTALLARLGAGGAHPNNCERDLHRLVRREHPLDLEPWSVMLPHWSKKSAGIALALRARACCKSLSDKLGLT
eukprot:7465898-Alexandrium_andersonii.AAC.1